jgi:DNA-binding CsgD family transcriptional regulator
MDTGLLVPSPLGDDDVRGVATIGIPEASIAQYLRNRARYYPSLERLVDALRVRGAIDHEGIMGSAWTRVLIYDEIWAPLRIVGVMTGALVFRGMASGQMCFNRVRGSSKFRDRELERFRVALPLAAMADAAVTAWRAGRSAPAASLAALSPRERDVALLLRSGMQNKEIATALGTSVETVRKQTVAVYQKLGVRGRVQLLAHLATSVRR